MVFPAYITLLSVLRRSVRPVLFFSSLLVAEKQKWHNLPLSPLPITGHVSSFRLHTCCSRFGVAVLLGCPGELHEPEECICCGSDGKGSTWIPKTPSGLAEPEGGWWLCAGAQCRQQGAMACWSCWYWAFRVSPALHTAPSWDLGLLARGYSVPLFVPFPQTWHRQGAGRAQTGDGAQTGDRQGTWHRQGAGRGWGTGREQAGDGAQTGSRQGSSWPHKAQPSGAVFGSPAW